MVSAPKPYLSITASSPPFNIFTVKQIRIRLLHDRATQPPYFDVTFGLNQLIRLPFRCAPIQNLALGNQVVHGKYCFKDRCMGPDDDKSTNPNNPPATALKPHDRHHAHAF